MSREHRQSVTSFEAVALGRLLIPRQSLGCSPPEASGFWDAGGQESPESLPPAIAGSRPSGSGLVKDNGCPFTRENPSVCEPVLLRRVSDV